MNSRNALLSSSLLSIGKRKLFTALVLAAVAIVIGAPSQLQANSGPAGEILNIHTENVTLTTADVVWDTLHPSTSQVLVAMDVNYQPDQMFCANGSSVALNCNPDLPPDYRRSENLATHHRVRLSGLFPSLQRYITAGAIPSSYKVVGAYYYYVASQQANGVIATNPGPANVAGGTTPFLTLTTAPSNPSAAPNLVLKAFGASRTYQGHDLYIGLQAKLLGGPKSNLYLNDVSITGPSGADTATTALLLCSSSYQPNSLQSDYHYDTASKRYYCWDANVEANYWAIGGIALRLRTSGSTVPGNYTVTFHLQNSTQIVPVTYTYTVLPPAAFTATPPTTVPVLDTTAWTTNINSQFGAGYWCTALDNSNAAGDFTSFNYSNYAKLWNYDGGRVYQQLANFDPANAARWNHCAQLVLDPYKNRAATTGARYFQEPNMFASGMAMNYLRTGDTTMQNAVYLMADRTFFAQFYGWFSPWFIRVNAYQLDSFLAAEIAGRPRDSKGLVTRSVDLLLTNLDQIEQRGAASSIHTFEIGLAMKSLITYYEQSIAEGLPPDNRIPLEIGRMLNYLQTSVYVPDTHAFYYNKWMVPITANSSFVSLNGLVAPAYAWYWSLTGNSTTQAMGDILFAHMFDDGFWNDTAKEFNQVYEWGFDYIQWRTFPATAVSAILAASNPCGNAGRTPCVAPWPDTAPPIEFTLTYNGTIPTPSAALSATAIQATSATIAWNTYEDADSQVVYGLAANSYPNSTVVTHEDKAVPISTCPTTCQYAHTVVLTGLTPNTTYHFRARSHDASGNLATSADYSFRTAAQ